MTGMRASELRGLRWEDVDLADAKTTVRQRADKWGEIGSPKAAASRREMPLPSMVVNTLREWKLACPRRDTGRKDADDKSITELRLVFPERQGQRRELQEHRGAPMAPFAGR